MYSANNITGIVRALAHVNEGVEQPGTQHMTGLKPKLPDCVSVCAGCVSGVFASSFVIDCCFVFKLKFKIRESFSFVIDFF